MKLGGNGLGCALTIIGAVLSQNLFCGCNARPEAIAPEEDDATSVAAAVKSYEELLERQNIARYSDFLKTVKPVRVYHDMGHTVLVQTTIGGVEYGKYLVPVASSHVRLNGEGGWKLSSTGIYVRTEWGLGMAEVFDYSKRLVGVSATQGLPPPLKIEPVWMCDASP